MVEKAAFYRGRLFWGYWFPLIIYCVAIFVQSAYPTPESLPMFPYSDKVEHLLAYALMGGLFFRTLRKTWPFWGMSRIVLFSVILTTLYGVSDEIHQSFVASRTADILDVAADFAGGSFGAGCFFLGRLLFVKSGTGGSN